MDIVLAILLGALGTWVTLMIVVPIAGRLAEFSFPGWGAAAWKLAVIALVTNALSALLAPVSGILSWIAGFVVFWGLMVKWFEMNVLGAVLVVVISLFVRIFIVGAIIAIIVAAS
jgi:hypothetical protein